MRFAIIENGVVVNVAASETALADNWIESDAAQIGDVYDGEAFTPGQPDPAQVQASIVQATQQRLDDFARTRSYDGILSACTYATSTVPKFATEGQYAVQARDATWAALYAFMADVQTGTRQMPSGFEDVEPNLPTLEWPI